jgi:hypothetical protein
MLFCFLFRILHEAAPMIFVIVWLGAAVITINSQLLGGKMYFLLSLFWGLIAKFFVIFCLYRSFFQSVCVLGYCVFPIVVAALLCFITDPLFHSLVFRLIVCGIAFVWGTFGMFLFLLFSLKLNMVWPNLLCLPVFFFLIQHLLVFWLEWYLQKGKL